MPNEALGHAFANADVAKYDGGESLCDQMWKEESIIFFPRQRNDLSRGNDPY